MHRTEIRRSYLSANAEEYPAKAVFGPIADKAHAYGCRIHRFDTGHDIMIEDPRKFADALLTTAV
jgi:hypothetical protein